MAVTLFELKWLRQLFQDFQALVLRPILLCCNNQSVLHVVANPFFHERTKHIEIDYYFIRDAFQAGFTSPCYIHSNIELADILTKDFHTSHFHTSLLDANGHTVSSTEHMAASNGIKLA